MRVSNKTKSYRKNKTKNADDKWEEKSIKGNTVIRTCSQEKENSWNFEYVSMRNREKHQLGKWDNIICDDAREIWSEMIIKEEKKTKKKVGDKTCEERPMCEVAKPEYNTEQIGVG